MKIACSNIAWDRGDEAAALACLQRHGVTGLEIAPTKLWPDWHDATPAAARAAAADYRARGFTIASMQALLFGRPEALLFGADAGRSFEARLAEVARLGGALGARAAVLGAPKNRLRGALGEAEAMDRALPLLRRLAAVYADEGLVLALEPARPEYGGDFVTTTMQALACVRAVDHPGLGLHLDAAALHSAGETIEAVWTAAAGAGRRPVHYQLSEAGLGGFEQAEAPQRHNLEFLRSQRYDGWCAIEMRTLSGGVARHGPWSVLDALR